MAVRLLPEILQNQIAAGEVVERPASVVKELTENALDAGASTVEIVIAGAGLDLIRIADDGSGMTREDLALAVLRHATSKLPGNDLMDVRTLGFRGEALPSIGAVARLTLTSRHASESHAWAITVEGGRVGEPRPAALTRGTRVEVRDLFYATPARLKFQKSARSEAVAIGEIVERLALARPDVRFTLQTGDKGERVFAGRTGDGAGAARLAEVLGANAATDLLPVNAEKDGVRLEALIGRPQASSGTVRDQHLLVNGRAVKDRQLMGALRAAFGDTLARDRHPVGLLSLTLPPQELDVNVHPAKTEVRFRDPGLIRSLIVGGVRQALSDAGVSAVSASSAAALGALRPHPGNSTGYSTQTPVSFNSGFAEARQAAFEAFAPSARPAPAPVADNDHPLGAARAQIHATYIIAETPDALVVVDQHAAHERIVYERLKRGLEARGIARQILLIPEIVHLKPSDAEALCARNAELESFGLVIEPFGPGAVVVRESPAMLGDTDLKQLVQDLADEVGEWDRTRGLEERLWAVASRMACHGSVRAGRKLKPEEMNALLREMETTPDASTCNHGRPTYVVLGKGEIEKLFGRR
jgi:DNA mismatch repair protein MutL